MAQRLAGLRGRWGRAAAAAALGAGLGGCASTWDDVTSRDFHVRSLWERKEPLAVLRDSTDGDERAKALRALKEPRANGGSDVEQEQVVQLLTAAATDDPQPYCRSAPIAALGHFQDPRAAQALITAYETAGRLAPEVAGAVQQQALTALGQTKQSGAVAFLLRQARQPLPADGSDVDRQQVRDNRLAAVRALRGYEGSAEVAQAMAKLMQADKDVALRDRARETYVKVTGQEPPPAGEPEAAPDAKPGGDVKLAGGTD